MVPRHSSDTNRPVRPSGLLRMLKGSVIGGRERAERPGAIDSICAGSTTALPGGTSPVNAQRGRRLEPGARAAATAAARAANTAPVATQVQCQPPIRLAIQATSGGPTNWPQADHCCIQPTVRRDRRLRSAPAAPPARTGSPGSSRRASRTAAPRHSAPRPAGPRAARRRRRPPRPGPWRRSRARAAASARAPRCSSRPEPMLPTMFTAATSGREHAGRRARDAGLQVDRRQEADHRQPLARVRGEAESATSQGPGAAERLREARAPRRRGGRAGRARRIRGQGVREPGAIASDMPASSHHQARQPSAAIQTGPTSSASAAPKGM